jgi:hypothetical protein
VTAWRALVVAWAIAARQLARAQTSRRSQRLVPGRGLGNLSLDCLRLVGQALPLLGEPTQAEVLALYTSEHG